MRWKKAVFYIVSIAAGILGGMALAAILEYFASPRCVQCGRRIRI